MTDAAKIKALEKLNETYRKRIEYDQEELKERKKKCRVYRHQLIAIRNHITDILRGEP